jgi:hypothetical protein
VVGRFELTGLLGKLVMEGGHPGGYLEPNLELLAVQRLRQVVVRARLHALHEMLLALQRGQQHEVGVGLTLALPNPPAEVETVHPRHQPVAHDDVHGVLAVQIPGVRAVRRDEHLVAELLDGTPQRQPRDRVVFGDQDFHCAVTRDYRALGRRVILGARPATSVGDGSGTRAQRSRVIASTSGRSGLAR